VPSQWQPHLLHGNAGPAAPSVPVKGLRAVRPRSRRRLTVLLGVSALLLLAAAPSAQAALSFTFDRASARPGMSVVAFQPGWPSAPSGITVYLVPTRLPGVRPCPAPEPAETPRLHSNDRLGGLRLRTSKKVF